MLGLQDDINDIELKQRWRLYWLESVFEFSSTSMQKKLWKSNSDFKKCISAYFDDLALYDAYEKALKSQNVSKQEVEASKTFHTLAVFYDESEESPETILQDPEWIEVVEAAQEFWNFLKKTVTSQRELDLIENLEKEFS